MSPIFKFLSLFTAITIILSTFISPASAFGGEKRTDIQKERNLNKNMKQLDNLFKTKGRGRKGAAPKRNNINIQTVGSKVDSLKRKLENKDKNVGDALKKDSPNRFIISSGAKEFKATKDEAATITPVQPKRTVDNYKRNQPTPTPNTKDIMNIESSGYLQRYQNLAMDKLGQVYNGVSAKVNSAIKG
ncbi:putative secreted protein [Wickerhamomyces ciferrii]|uniref:Secreted protein n=1 Tax=Wickerhamomyces ciferrii (strain ATCC 14091 / BCRC 22168 / CBS 111 / JCM 3599 / NBRC 0793 / NRRL Y-1031 F-60-10) TaxID=1206466 RepID=K0KLX6_WICCF|nr:uncharacterized protein BN7_3556 [Wickerhamomyces ciferrii]CCH44001.1 putative secreted protein [Wickerhamomyces ciferrii]